MESSEHGGYYEKNIIQYRPQEYYNLRSQCLADFEEQKISMEEGKTEEEMDIIMWYLVEEGFIDTETKTLRQLE